MQANQTHCPICDGLISIGVGTLAAEIIPCPECGCDLEVQSLEPLAIAPAPCAEEDWGE